MEHAACDLCDSITTKCEETNVKNVVIKTAKGLIKFKFILDSIFGMLENTEHVCSKCQIRVVHQYVFQEQVINKHKLRSTGSQNIYAKVRDFLIEANESTSVVVHQGIFSIVPDSLMNRFNSNVMIQNNYNPVLALSQRSDESSIDDSDSLLADDLGTTFESFIEEISSPGSEQNASSPLHASKKMKLGECESKDLDILNIFDLSDVGPRPPVLSNKQLESMKCLIEGAKVQNSSSYQCPLCFKNFDSKTTIGYHIKYTHILKEIVMKGSNDITVNSCVKRNHSESSIDEQFDAEPETNAYQNIDPSNDKNGNS